MKTQITHKIVATAAILETHKAAWPLSKLEAGNWFKFDMTENAFGPGELVDAECADDIESAELEALKSLFDNSEYLEQLDTVALIDALKEGNNQPFFVEDTLSLLNRLDKCKEVLPEDTREEVENLTARLANYQRHSL